MSRAAFAASLLLAACGARSELLGPPPRGTDAATRDASTGGDASRDAGPTSDADPACRPDAETPQPPFGLVGRACQEACEAWARPLGPGRTVHVFCSGGRTREPCVRGTACSGPPHACVCGRGDACAPGFVCVSETADSAPTCQCIGR